MRQALSALLCSSLFVFLIDISPAPAQWGELRTRCRTEWSTFKSIKRSSQAFTPEQECPATEISVSREALLKTWEEFQGSKQEQDLGTEFQVALELSLTASSLWNDLLQEAGGDAEKARQSYLNKRISKGLKTRIVSLREQIEQFTHTSEIELVRGGRGATEFFDPKGGAEFPLVHPLFVQLLLENIAQYKIYHRVDTRYWSNGSNLRSMPSEDDPRVKGLVQTLKLLYYVSPDQCSNYGLFPRAARGVLSALKTLSMFHAVDHRGSLVGYGLLMTSIEGRAFSRSCGYPGSDGNSADPYGNNSEDFLKRYRSMRF